jgi:hypothetical protein
MTTESRPALVLDACVMMSGLLRPLLLDLAAAGLFSPLWTYKIGQEWQRNAARLWDIEPHVLEIEWSRMQERFPLADMGDVTEHEASLKHTDKKDKHVAAAGVAAIVKTDCSPISVVTWNTKDFSRSELRRQQLGLIDPDRLLSLWWPMHQALLRQQIESTIQALVETGRRQPEATIAMLKRDRLFRLARCYAR